MERTFIYSGFGYLIFGLGYVAEYFFCQEMFQRSGALVVLYAFFIYLKKEI
jgi:hypothetical protein